ncbi:MAG: hypothetical protein CMG13_04945 [Candidatus Marinimicrobia bacterium]|nr:hypothetical protein [Candidatus Neomarinimicrobiota bacterium]
MLTGSLAGLEKYSPQKMCPSGLVVNDNGLVPLVMLNIFLKALESAGSFTRALSMIPINSLLPSAVKWWNPDLLIRANVLEYSQAL